MYQCAANHNKGWQLNFSLRCNLKKQWNTVIRSENIGFVYMLMGSYVLLSRTEIFNVIVYGTVSAKIAPRLKCYKKASRLNRYNFPTDNAIDFLFSTLHSEMV